MKVIYLTNIPAPYREKCHEIIFKKLNNSYSVIYCSKIEPNRKWFFYLANIKKVFYNHLELTWEIVTFIFGLIFYRY